MQWAVEAADERLDDANGASILTQPTMLLSSQVKQESAAKQEQRFDASTRQFMFTMTKVSKKAPSGKDIFRDVSISFYPGAKVTAARGRAQTTAHSNADDDARQHRQ